MRCTTRMIQAQISISTKKTQLKTFLPVCLKINSSAFATAGITREFIHSILVTARRYILVCRELLHECLGDCPLFLLNHCLYLLQ